jgi:hypothetical protein
MAETFYNVSFILSNAVIIATVRGTEDDTKDEIIATAESLLWDEERISVEGVMAEVEEAYV